MKNLLLSITCNFLTLICFSQSTTPLNGVYKKYYDNGKLWRIMNYKDGKLDGEEKMYHENGQLKGMSIYKDGNLDGESKWYYENGKIEKIENYKNGRDGEWKWYYKNGNLSQVINYKNDNEDGEWKEYYENGNTKRILKCKDGLPIGEEKGWYENGKLNFIGNHKDTLSEWKEFYENGNIKSIGNYLVRHFLDIVYTKHGEWKEYYESGKLYHIGNYHYDGLVGKSIFYYESGKLFQIINNIDDQTGGEWKIYSENGKLIGKGILNDGFHGEELYNDNIFPKRAFINCVANSIHLDSLISDEENENNKIGYKIPDPMTYDFKNEILIHIIRSLENETLNFSKIKFNHQYNIRLEYSDENSITLNNFDKWSIIFIDNYKYKINYWFDAGRVNNGERDFFYDIKTNKKNASITNSKCFVDWARGYGYKCQHKTFVIRDNIIISIKKSVK